MFKHQIAGKVFGRLTAIRQDTTEGLVRTAWICRCECGVEKSIRTRYLVECRVRSCGCLASEATTIRNFKHGGMKSITYQTWRSMDVRCHNPKQAGFKYWGGRGITICDRWNARKNKDAYKNFVTDMGERPSKEYTIDRIDNEGGYFKENCRWATIFEQRHNRRDYKKEAA